MPRISGRTSEQMESLRGMLVFLSSEVRFILTFVEILIYDSFDNMKQGICWDFHVVC